MLDLRNDRYDSVIKKSEEEKEFLFWQLITNLFLPGPNGVERDAIGGWKSQDRRLGASVISFSDGVKLLLTGRVPQHQPYLFAVDSKSTKKVLESTLDDYAWGKELSIKKSLYYLPILDDPFEKIDADGLFVVSGEDAFAEALDHAGLADGAIAYNHHLLQDRPSASQTIEELE